MCPISHQLPYQYVQTSAHIDYSAKHIYQWLKHHDTNPYSRQKVEPGLYHNEQRHQALFATIKTVVNDLINRVQQTSQPNHTLATH